MCVRRRTRLTCVARAWARASEATCPGRRSAFPGRSTGKVGRVSTLPAAAATPRVRDARRRAVSGFALYDVANSAFVTTVITAVGGPFITSVAEAAQDGRGRVALLGLAPRADAVYAYALSFSVVLQVLTLPVLGALADRARAKRQVLVISTVVGAVASGLLALVPDGRVLAAVTALVVANVAYGAAICVYNAHLADVAEPKDRDRVSAMGFAYGYAGGAFVLAVALALVSAAGPLGMSKGTAGRMSIALAALWWLGVGMVAVHRLDAARRLPGKDPGPVTPLRLRDGLGQLRGSLAALRRLPLTARYLAAFLLFNDAVQAVIGLASVVLVQELYVARGRPEDDATSFLLTLVLLIQVVAVAGAFLAGRLAARVGAKRVVLGTLVLWTGVVLYAVLALTSQAQAYALGVVIALVLGGSQSLARSLFSTMVPDDRQASFFGFYELAERGTAWIGTLVFAVVLDVTGSYRGALLSLLVLFVSGGILLAATDTDEAARVAQRA